MRKIVALVPIRNEAYIIPDFIKVTLEIADFIIFALQLSIDGTSEAIPNDSRILVICNNNAEYSELDRQQLLINEARSKFGLDNVLLAIDCDEFFFPVECSPSEARAELLSIAPGTTLLFDKPTLVKNFDQAISYGPSFPLGYVDDGRPHEGSEIHSTRVPFNNKSLFRAMKISFIHMDFIDINAHLSKRRYYSCLEKNLGHSFWLRFRRSSRSAVRSQMNLAKMNQHSKSMADWFSMHSIDLRNLKRREPYWWDCEVLRFFDENGTKKYWMDDIWYVDWSAVRRQISGIQAAKAYCSKTSGSGETIRLAPFWCRILLLLASWLYSLNSFRVIMRKTLRI